MAGASRTLTIKFVGDSKSAVRSVKDMVSSMDDTESAGKRVAKAMGILSDDAETAFRDAKDAADKLATALGEDTVAEIKAAGRSVEGYIGDLQRMGLSYDDVRVDVDELADAIRKVETAAASMDAPRTAAKDLGDEAKITSGKIDMVRDSGDQSRSVLANMVGNSTQELGALGGIAGTVGMSLGQIGEYAAEGNIKLSSLAKVAAPMAALGVVMWGIEKSAKQSAKNLESLNEQVEILSTVADEQVVDSFVRSLALGFVEGQSLNEVIEKMAVDNLPGLKRALDLGTESGRFNAEQQEQIALAIAKADAAVIQAKKTNDEYGESLGNTNEALFQNTGTLESFVATIDAAAAASYEQTLQIEKYTKAVDASRVAAQKRLETERTLYGFMLSQIDAQRAYEVAVDSGEDAIRSFDEVLGSNKSTLEEIDDAARTSADSLISQAEAFAASKGAADGSKESIRLQSEELFRLAMAMDPNSTLRARLVGYITELQSIPPTVDTMLRLSISAGAVVTKDGDEIGIRAGTGRAVNRAAGGPVSPAGIYAVGDNPDGSWNATTELFVPSQSGNILSAADSRSALGGAGHVTNVYLNVYPTPLASPADIGRQVREALLADARTSGPVFATVRN